MANEKLECQCGTDAEHVQYRERNGEYTVVCKECLGFLKFITKQEGYTNVEWNDMVVYYRQKNEQ